jgi:hypothetical protein
MTAGNDINVTQGIATANGTVALTATNGSITLPVGTEVIAPVFDAVLNMTVDQNHDADAGVYLDWQRGRDPHERRRLHADVARANDRCAHDHVDPR